MIEEKKGEQKMLQVENTGKSQIKSRNKVRVFGEILKQDGISRKQLEKQLSLSAPSITRVVESLLKEGMVYEEGTRQTHVGRRPVKLFVKKSAYYSIGMNLSRSRLYYCVKNLGGEVIYTNCTELNGADKGKDLLGLIDEAAGDAIQAAGIGDKQLIAIGVASRGTVNVSRGSVIYTPDSGEEILVKKHLKETYGCEVLVENNVIADLKGQYLEADDVNRNLVYLYLSDGVGGSIICNGQVVDGADSMAGKFAHILVETEGRLCACGKKGHLESYVSRPAMEEAYYERTGRKETLGEICSLVGKGDKAAAEVLKQAVDKLAVGIVQILLVLNPGTLVLYGELFESLPEILKQLRLRTEELAFSKEITQIRWLLREKKNVRIEESIAWLAVENVLEIIG